MENIKSHEKSASAGGSIHPTAIIHPGTKIGAGVEIAPYAVIGPDVIIGDGTSIGAHAVVEYVTIGRNCRIFSHAFVGTPPQDLKYKGEPTRAEVGDGTVIRECVTLNRGTQQGRALTTVGKNCLLMAYSHVAHDCVVGDNVIMANLATLAGHIDVGEGVFIGGHSAIHQFTRIGQGAMLGGGAMVPSDVAPFCMVQGDRAVAVGLNVVGLRRRGVTGERMSALKNAYRTVFHKGLSLKDAVEAVEKGPMTPEVRIFADFLKNPSRGLTRPAARGGDSAENDAD
jgi:UDP-N-acetylglucosamine acyltransferase